MTFPYIHVEERIIKQEDYDTTSTFILIEGDSTSISSIRDTLNYTLEHQKDINTLLIPQQSGDTIIVTIKNHSVA